MTKKERAAYAKEWRRKHPGYQPNQDASIRRECTVCKTEKPATLEFFGKEKTRPLGLSSWCKECSTTRHAAYNKAHRDEVNVRQRKWRTSERERVYTLRYAHKMTVEEFDALLKAQNGVCAICGNPPTARDKFVLHVDHVHDETQRNRGLLCTLCNHAIERIESIEGWADKAIAYLVKHEIAKREQELAGGQ